MLNWQLSVHCVLLLGYQLCSESSHHGIVTAIANTNIIGTHRMHIQLFLRISQAAIVAEQSLTHISDDGPATVCSTIAL